MGRYDWLLFLHVTGAFLFLGANVVAVVVYTAAQRSERPSEVALLLRLLSGGLVAAAGVLGLLLVFALGLWLVDDAGYGYGDGWIVAALVLFVLSNVFGALGGARGKPARTLAERLAADGDHPSDELKALLRTPLVLFLNYGAGVLAFGVLVMMIWKPGAGG